MANINPPLIPEEKYWSIYENWDDPKNYIDQTFLADTWGWEMLRRNPKYQRDFERAQRLIKIKKLFLIDREAFYYYKEVPETPCLYIEGESETEGKALVDPLYWLLTRWRIKSRSTININSLAPTKRFQENLLSFYKPWVPETANKESSKEYGEAQWSYIREYLSADIEERDVSEENIIPYKKSYEVGMRLDDSQVAFLCDPTEDIEYQIDYIRTQLKIKRKAVLEEQGKELLKKNTFKDARGFDQDQEITRLRVFDAYVVAKRKKLSRTTISDELGLWKEEYGQFMNKSVKIIKNRIEDPASFVKSISKLFTQKTYHYQPPLEYGEAFGGKPYYKYKNRIQKN